MAAAARAGVREAAVRAELEKQLTDAADPGLAKAVPRTVAFQTTKNFSNLTLAGTAVEAGFSAAALTTMIRDKYWQALLGAQNANVAVTGLGDVSVNVQQSVRNLTQTGGAQAANAATAAGSAVGSAGGPTTFFGFPVIAPPSGLVGKLMDIPNTWGTAGSALEAGVTSAAFSTKMEAILKVAGAAAGLATALAGLLPGPGPAKIAGGRELYLRAYSMVNTAAAEAAKQLSAELLNTVIPPMINSGVTDVQSAIQTEVEKVMGTPPAGIAALGSNPAMAALVTTMKARLDADKTASAGGGRDPVGTGKAAPEQDVTYSYQGLMGSHGTMAIREDQLNPLVKQFNLRCLTLWEKAFKAEVK